MRGAREVIFIADDDLGRQAGGSCARGLICVTQAGSQMPHEKRKRSTKLQEKRELFRVISLGFGDRMLSFFAVASNFKQT